jgi:hypothetical protein
MKTKRKDWTAKRDTNTTTALHLIPEWSFAARFEIVVVYSGCRCNKQLYAY